MTDFCPDNSIDPAVLLTLQAHDRFTELSTQNVKLALDDLDGFDTVNLSPISFNIPFNFNGELTQFHRPARPSLDTSKFDFRDPGDVPAAPGFSPNAVQNDEAPTFDTPMPALNFAPRPNRPNVAMPVAPPTPARRPMPEEPDYAAYTPAPVTLQSLNLPTLNPIQLPEFDAERPTFVEPPLNQNWSFNPEAYTGALLQDLQGKLRAMIQGQAALPLAIQQAILDRGRDRIEIEGQRALDQVYSEFAARGFSEPNGLLAARVADQRQANQNAIGELNRDLTIKDFEEALVNLRFAITQGAALEGVTIQLHIEEQRFLLQAAQFGRESDIAILNARVTVFNAKMQGYQIDAQVLETRIRAELAKLDEYRAKLEGERLRGEINQQTVALYTAQWDAVKTLADFFRSRVEAVKVEADADRIPLEIYREQINAADTVWRAYGSEVQAYAAANDAEGKKADVVETFGKIFATRMQGYSTLQDSRYRGEELRIRQHGALLQAWEAGLRRKANLLDAERARLVSVAQEADAIARLYTADAAVATAESSAQDRTFQLGLAEAQARVETQLKSADITLQQHLGLIQQLVEIVRARAQISGQLAASTMSAMNYGASVSSGRSKSDSCSQAFSFTGEIADSGQI